MNRFITPFVLILVAACDTLDVYRTDDSNLQTTDEVPLDCDGDGYGLDEDCDDNDASVYPGASDICDGIDNDCDPAVAYDENGEVIPTSFGEPDLCDDHDDDSWSLGEDCDDNDATVYPGATETDNGIDDDCDGEIDEGFDTEPVDADGDGYTEADGDCDDNNAFVHPGAMEICGNDVDEDCDGIAEDQDGDGNLTSGSHPDCDDTDAAVYYGASELCDRIDNDCDGDVDEDCDPEPVDSDGDGYDVDEDCDDSDASVNPGATEVCGDGLDNDCSGSDASCGPTDADGDGYNSFIDCDDTDASINPGASEVFNDSVDNNCDGQEDEATSLYLVAEYSSNVDMELSIWTWSDGDDITTGTRWVYYDDVENDTQIVAELSTDEYPMDCGFRFSITVNDSSWSCQASAMDGVNFDFLVWTAETDWIDETDLEVWIADASTGSCSLYVQTDNSSACDPVDDE